MSSHQDCGWPIIYFTTYLYLDFINSLTFTAGLCSDWVIDLKFNQLLHVEASSVWAKKSQTLSFHRWWYEQQSRLPDAWQKRYPHHRYCTWLYPLLYPSTDGAVNICPNGTNSRRQGTYMSTISDQIPVRYPSGIMRSQDLSNMLRSWWVREYLS